MPFCGSVVVATHNALRFCIRVAHPLRGTRPVSASNFFERQWRVTTDLRIASATVDWWRGATFETIRRAFVKVAVRVEELNGRIKLAFPASYPQAAMLVAMTGTITTRGP